MLKAGGWGPGDPRYSLPDATRWRNWLWSSTMKSIMSWVISISIVSRHRPASPLLWAAFRNQINNNKSTVKFLTYIVNTCQQIDDQRLKCTTAHVVCVTIVGYILTGFKWNCPKILLKTLKISLHQFMSILSTPFPKKLKNSFQQSQVYSCAQQQKFYMKNMTSFTCGIEDKKSKSIDKREHVIKKKKGRVLGWTMSERAPRTVLIGREFFISFFSSELLKFAFSLASIWLVFSHCIDSPQVWPWQEKIWTDFRPCCDFRNLLQQLVKTIATRRFLYFFRDFVNYFLLEGFRQLGDEISAVIQGNFVSSGCWQLFFPAIEIAVETCESNVQGLVHHVITFEWWASYINVHETEMSKCYFLRPLISILCTKDHKKGLGLWPAVVSDLYPQLVKFHLTAAARIAYETRYI